MKISRKQIRKIIKEEMSRELPISYYSDEVLIQEGLMDFLGNLFGGLVDFFGSGSKEAEGKVSGSFEEASGEVTTLAKKLLGDEEGKEIKTFKDLDMEKKDHQKILYAAIAPAVVELMEKALSKLEIASTVGDWTPKDDSEEAQDEWEKTEGENSLKLWGASGTVAGVLTFFENHGMKAAKEALTLYDAILKEANPGAAAEWIATVGTKTIEQIFDFAKTAGIKTAGATISAAEAVAKGAQAVAEQIAASAEKQEEQQEEQQKESLELRKMINHMILCESNDN